MDNLWEQSPPERVVELDANNEKVGKIALTFSLLIFLLVFVGLAFGTGYFIGRLKSTSTKTVSKEPSTTKTENGKTTFEDKNEGYSLVFPEAWKSKEKEGKAPGVTLTTEGASIELWLRVEQPYTFAKEQKDAIVKTNKLKIKVNGKEVEMTEHVYNTGGFFTVIVLPATEAKPIATFWIKANDEELYTAAKEIVQSFKFN